MNDEKRDAYNREYFGITVAQQQRHNELMAMKICDWPPALGEYVQAKCNRIGFCGDVVATAVADWLKKNNSGSDAGVEGER